MKYLMNIFANSLDKRLIERKIVSDEELKDAVSCCVDKNYAYDLTEIKEEERGWE